MITRPPAAELYQLTIYNCQLTSINTRTERGMLEIWTQVEQLLLVLHSSILNTDSFFTGTCVPNFDDCLPEYRHLPQVTIQFNIISKIITVHRKQIFFYHEWPWVQFFSVIVINFRFWTLRGMYWLYIFLLFCKKLWVPRMAPMFTWYLKKTSYRSEVGLKLF